MKKKVIDIRLKNTMDLTMMKKIICIAILCAVAYGCARQKSMDPLQRRNHVFQQGILTIVDNFRKPEIASANLMKIIKENDFAAINKNAEDVIRSQKFSRDDLTRFAGLKQSYFKMALNLVKMSKAIFLPAHQEWTKAWGIGEKSN